MEIDAEVWGSLSASLRGMAAAVERRARQDQRMAEAIRVVPLPAQTQNAAGGTVFIASASNVLGPSTGYAWAVQSVTVAGLGSSDSASLYAGPAGPASVVPANFRQVFTAAAPSWQPGRTGFILNYGDTLMLMGTGLSTAQLTLSGQVVIMESWMLTEFLL